MIDNSSSYYSGVEGWKQLNSMLLSYPISEIFILVDSNTRKHCLPVLLSKINNLKDCEVISIPAGENSKTIESAQIIWKSLLQKKASKGSLIICLGGGMITDLGGFAAATFKRGIDFIHLPTTLLGMVDASIGGKTALNFNKLKNQIGAFAQPMAIFVFTEFLQSLPLAQKLSGFAEMIKHAMIDNEAHFQKLIILNSPEKVCVEEMILKSSQVKFSIVNQDIDEKGIRRALNYGHTVGHAIESYSSRIDSKPLSHGEAVAIGLLCESFISMRYAGFSESNLKKLANLLSWHFPHYKMNSSISAELIELMSFDKKNMSSSQINFSLLKEIGQVEINQLPDVRLIRESLHFYMNLENGFFL